MKYLKAIAIAILIYLGTMVYAWVEYKVVLPLWQAVGLTIFFALILYRSISKDKKKQEDIELDLGTKLVEAENLRMDAENFILNSGDEQAINILKRAKANRYSYIRILSDGKDNCIDTTTIALGILSGMFKKKIILGLMLIKFQKH